MDFGWDFFEALYPVRGRRERLYVHWQMSAISASMPGTFRAYQNQTVEREFQSEALSEVRTRWGAGWTVVIKWWLSC